MKGGFIHGKRTQIPDQEREKRAERYKTFSQDLLRKSICSEGVLRRPSAKISYARVSVQKACYVLDAIRGKDVTTALGILAYNPRYASTVIEKLLKSAIANAENNNGMSVDNLYIEECYANKGPTMKRIRPRAQGRAYRIEKRAE